jgi:hypothetical protein
MGYGKQNTDPYPTMTGMGGEIDTLFLQEMSKQAEGNFYYMENPDACGRAFAYELAGLLTTVAQNVEVVLEPQNGNKILEVLSDVDTEEEKDGKVKITIPDVISEEVKKILVKFSVPAIDSDKVRPRPVNVLKSKATYSDRDGKQKTIDESIKLKFVSNEKADTNLNEEIKSHLAILEAIGKQSKAMEEANNGNYTLATDLIDQGIKVLNDIGDEECMRYSSVLDSTKEFYSNQEQWLGNVHNAYATNYTMKTRKSAGDIGTVFCSASQNTIRSRGFEFDKDEGGQKEDKPNNKFDDGFVFAPRNPQNVYFDNDSNDKSNKKSDSGLNKTSTIDRF